ncbi:MAG: hypothetical protein LBS33_07115 [Streptococcaceae bacterium]|jgi:YbbR domain-containing protein|nr:hypothetical protein [Streptococcaceae bacterium]
MNKRKFLKHNAVYLFISFLFAILLFVNANATNIKNNVDKINNLATYDATLHDIPVQINYDSSKYFLSGFDNNVSVYLTSYNRVRLDAEKSEATRHFSVIADLSKIKTGTITVPLRLQGLTNGVNGQVDPAQISITVERRVSKEFDVTPVVNQEQLGAHYTLDDVSVSAKKVRVTSGGEMIKKISQIRATLPDDVDLQQNYEGEVDLKAFDEAGDEIPAEITPEKVYLTVGVKAPSKTVPLIAVQAGTLSDKVEQANLTLSQDTAVISGKQKDIDKISQIKVAVDMTGITTKRTISQALMADNVVVEPSKIKVTITPVMKAK